MQDLRQPSRLIGVIAACLVTVAAAACSKSGLPGPNGASGGAAAGGTAARGGGSGNGGQTASGGTPGTGGLPGTGGVPNAGGAPSTGGINGAGDVGVTGGNVGRGGIPGTGGVPNTGGAPSTGGISGAGDVGVTGGNVGRGGIPAAGGTSAAGGAPSAGGTSGAGGVAGAGGASLGTDAGARGGAGAGGSPGIDGATNTCPPGTSGTGGKQYCSNSKGNGNGSYAYELWSSGTGTGCMTVYSKDATFSATWTSVGDFLARIGLGFDQTKTPAQIGTISSDFAETKTGDTGLVYVGIYGWTVSPLREYYIIEDWGSSKPADTASDGTPRTHVGTITVDGDTYDVWKHTQTNKPAITGNNQTFDQYFSVRQTARQCGHISISEHFTQWLALGLQLGNLEEAKLLVEAQNSTGTINFTTATVVVK